MKVRALTPLKHDDEHHPVGAVLEVEPKTFKELKALNAVEKMADDAKAPKKATPDGGSGDAE